MYSISRVKTYTIQGLIQGLRQANEWQRYFVTTSLIGWAQAYNQPCYMRTLAPESFSCIYGMNMYLHST